MAAPPKAASRPLDIAISGAGIAGLVAALLLARGGHRVHVFERAETLDDVGAGIQLSPNAMRILARLGLERAIAAVSFEPDALVMHDAPSGRQLVRVPFKPRMRNRHGAPYLVTHRADLQKVLLDALSANRSIMLETGSGLTADAIAEDATSISVAGQRFDALLVADGLRSALRAVIDPRARIVADGQTAWRGTLPMGPHLRGFDPATTALHMGRGAHLVMYPMGGRQTVNLVLVADTLTATPQGAVSDWHPNTRAMLGKVGNWLDWPLHRVECSVWAKGRMALMGDAAHAMTPHAAQGGAMAIEDAAALAQNLSMHLPVPEALARYGRQRMPRVARVAALSKANRDIYQATGAVALARNAAMTLAPPELLLKRMDWLYGGS